MAVINQLDIRRGNANGSVVTTTYDIGASAENVLMSDGVTSVEAAIAGGSSVKFEGFGHITEYSTSGSETVATFKLYNNENYTDVYNGVSNKAGLFIIKFDANRSNEDNGNLRLRPYADPNNPKLVIKQNNNIKANVFAQNAIGIFLRNNNTYQECYELIGVYDTPYINTNGTLVLI